MNPAIEAHLKLQANYSSPPGVAGHIIQLAQDPAIELDQVAKAVSMDSALTANGLCTANSRPVRAVAQEREHAPGADAARPECNADSRLELLAR